MQTEKMIAVVNIIEIAISIGVIAAEAERDLIGYWSGDRKVQLMKAQVSDPNDTRGPYVNSGARVAMVIAPAVVFFPNSVPCGPRSTST